MRTELLEVDYCTVRDVSLEAAFASTINPIRCHEMAYLISTGMNSKGYNSRLKDGVLTGKFQTLSHTWVEIPSKLGMINGVVINFWFNPLSWLFADPIWHDEIITSWRERRSHFTHKPISYTLAHGIQDLAETLWGLPIQNQRR